MSAAPRDVPTTSSVEVAIHGRNTKVPAAVIEGHTVIVAGKYLRVASVKDEMFLEGEVVKDPKGLVETLRSLKLKADVFTFSQKPPDVQPKYNYRIDWDNLAAIRTDDFNQWWEKRLPQETRKNVRRAQKRGVTVNIVTLNDELIRGIIDIYNETPIRQGKPFAHYGKDFATIRREVSTFADTSEFIAAYYKDELIGFIKLVRLGPIASILHIVSKNQHYDKRPTNALIAAAVDHCMRSEIRYLVYGSYTYGQKTNSSLSEFKRRNGFEKVMIPRYFIPLTPKGRVAIALKLHLGLVGILPPALITVLLNLRAKGVKGMLALKDRRGRQKEAEPVES